MTFDDVIYESLQDISEVNATWQRQIEEACYIAACVDFSEALERGSNREELVSHCEKILRLGERVCEGKSFLAITPAFREIYYGLRRQADAGRLFDERDVHLRGRR